MSERLVRLPVGGGRTLGVAQWGDPAGFPVFWLHGTPGSRYARPVLEDAVRELGVRVVTYDRPGYGVSTRHRGRRVVDCVADVAAVADALGIDRFAVTGGSGGGPHALAVGAGLPTRVLRVRCVVGVAPSDAQGLDFLGGMDPMNVREFGWALQGEEVLHRELQREAAADLDRLASDPSKLLSDDWQVDEADRAVMADERAQVVMGEMMREAYRHGAWGWVDDDLAFTRPWGFDLAEIRVPAEVRYGAKDVLVPAAHGAWLAAHVPGAEVTVLPEAGHLAGPEAQLEALRTLVAACR